MNSKQKLQCAMIILVPVLGQFRSAFRSEILVLVISECESGRDLPNGALIETPARPPAENLGPLTFAKAEDHQVGITA